MDMDERGHTVDVQERHRHHAPTAAQIEGMNRIREAIDRAERAIRLVTPPCRGQSNAITRLEEARMWGNMAALLGQGTNLR